MTQPPTGSPDPYQFDPYQQGRSSAPDAYAPPGGSPQGGPEQPAYAPPAGAPYGAPEQAAYDPTQPYGTEAPTQPYPSQPYGAPDPSQQQAPYGAPYAAYPSYGPPTPSPTNVLAITGFVLAIVGLLGCWIPGLNVVAAILGLAGLVLGIVGLTQVKKGKTGKGFALSAIIVGALAIVGTILTWVLLFVWADSVTTEYENSLTELQQELEDTGTAAPEEEPAEDPAAEDPAVADGLTAAFGETFVYEDGLEVSVSAPSDFTPTETASGGEDFTEFVRFDVTITNGTGEAFDPSLAYVTASSAGVEADQVFDVEIGLDGGPTTSVLPGESVTFPAGFGVTDPAALLVELSPSFEYDGALFSTGS